MLPRSGRLLRRSAHLEDRPAIFAAQFALSHACWLVAYPLAGLLMTLAGAPAALLGLGLLAFFGILAAIRLWPASDPQILLHSHEDLPAGHPHPWCRQAGCQGRCRPLCSGQTPRP